MAGASKKCACTNDGSVHNSAVGVGAAAEGARSEVCTTVSGIFLMEDVSMECVKNARATFHTCVHGTDLSMDTECSAFRSESSAADDVTMDFASNSSPDTVDPNDLASKTHATGSSASKMSIGLDRPDHQNRLLQILKRDNLLEVFGMDKDKEFGMTMDDDSSNVASTDTSPGGTAGKPQMRFMRAKALASDGPSSFGSEWRRLPRPSCTPATDPAASSSVDGSEDNRAENFLHKLLRNTPMAPDTFTSAGSASHMLRRQKRTASLPPRTAP